MTERDLLPDRLGEYRLLERIGEGGMGVVYLARDPRQQTVALKVLRSTVAGEPTARRRLAREVETMQRVRSPFVAEVLDADLAGDTPYIVTRYVPGRTLDELVTQEGPLQGATLSRLACGLADALVAVHAAGVVHRDLKPSNVMLVDGSPVVIDFGIAQGPEATRLTLTGMFMGTPGYLAPEVIEGRPSSEASDVHAWGATIAYAATGRPPYGTGQYETIFYRIVNGRPDLEGVPAPLLPLLTTVLARDPAQRPSAIKLSAQAVILDPAALVPGPASAAPPQAAGSEWAGVTRQDAAGASPAAPAQAKGAGALAAGAQAGGAPAQRVAAAGALAGGAPAGGAPAEGAAAAGALAGAVSAGGKHASLAPAGGAMSAGALVAKALAARYPAPAAGAGGPAAGSADVGAPGAGTPPAVQGSVTSPPAAGLSGLAGRAGQPNGGPAGSAGQPPPATRPLAAGQPLPDDLADVLTPVRYGPYGGARPAPGWAQAGAAAANVPESGGGETAASKRPRWHPLFAVAAMVIAASMSVILPVAGTLASLGFIAVLRATGLAQRRSVTRRLAHGARATDPLLVAASFPWFLLRATLTMLLLAPFALATAAVAAGAAVALAPADWPSRALAFAAGTLVAFYGLGPGSARPRKQLSRMFAAVASSPSAQIVALAGMAVLAFAAVTAAASGPSLFWPAIYPGGFIRIGAIHLGPLRSLGLLRHAGLAHRLAVLRHVLLRRLGGGGWFG